MPGWTRTVVLAALGLALLAGIALSAARSVAPVVRQPGSISGCVAEAVSAACQPAPAGRPGSPGPAEQRWVSRMHARAGTP
jgi:hypothetical protein